MINLKVIYFKTTRCNNDEFMKGNHNVMSVFGTLRVYHKAKYFPKRVTN